MNLVVFDLDGTLTKTNTVDDECFVQAFADALGMHQVNTQWTEYEHVTDLGVLWQAFVEHFGRPPEPSEYSKFIDCFLKFLKQRHAANAELFAEIPGAGSLLCSLKETPEWAVAIATGCWEPSARFKMRAAGIEGEPFPSAFADDGPSREAIVQAAIARASERYQQSSFERIVSVGDATWDVRTARRLGLPFLGVGGARRTERLRQEGATHTIENFLNTEQFMRRIEEADVPTRALRAGERVS